MYMSGFPLELLEISKARFTERFTWEIGTQSQHKEQVRSWGDGEVVALTMEMVGEDQLQRCFP